MTEKFDWNNIETQDKKKATVTVSAGAFNINFNFLLDNELKEALKPLGKREVITDLRVQSTNIDFLVTNALMIDKIKNELMRVIKSFGVDISLIENVKTLEVKPNPETEQQQGSAESENN